MTKLCSQSHVDLSTEDKVDLSHLKIPKHIAIIPDGNRRWAKQKGYSIPEGHYSGTENVFEIVQAAQEIGIKRITFYSFSTENWSRDKLEVAAFLWIIEYMLRKKCPHMVELGVRLSTIGDLSRFSQGIKNAISETKEATQSCNRIEMVLALNYGARDEIKRAAQALALECINHRLKPEEITESLVSRYLDTGEWEDPDLLIRTSGELRTSNFLLWQTAYSEMYYTPVYWPDFKPPHLMEAIKYYQTRNRRFGE